MKVLLAIFLLNSSCGATEPKEVVDKSNNRDAYANQVLANDTLKSLMLRVKSDNRIPYKLSLIQNTDGEKTFVVSVGNMAVKEISLPSQEDINGFSFEDFGETSKGFRISIEYGSRFYYNKVFYFDHSATGFILTRLEITEFDKREPSKERKSKKSLSQPLLRFRLIDFTED